MRHELPILAEHFINYLTSKKKTSHTLVSYRQQLNYWFNYLITLKEGYYRITDIDISFIKSLTFEEFNSYLDKLSEEGKKPKSIAKYIAIMQSFLSYLVRVKKMLECNTALGLIAPDEEEKLVKYLTEEQVKDLLNAVDSKRDYERDYAIIKLYANCGLRLSETINIKLSDITGDAIHIHGKGNKERLAYLNDECIKAINNYLEVRPKTDCEYLFVRKYRGKYDKMQNNGTSSMVVKYAKKAKLPEWFTTHVLRHTYGTLAVEKGMSLLAVQESMGHASEETTKIYTHVSSKSRRELANTLSL